LQRSLSRKGHQRGGEKKITPSATANERDNIGAATSSPRGTIFFTDFPFPLLYQLSVLFLKVLFSLLFLFSS
jgi:hypothetical protein